jgi:hypothetical protein
VVDERNMIHPANAERGANVLRPCASRGVEPITHRTFREFKGALKQVALIEGRDISLSDRLHSIVPSSERRRVWQELREAGWELPGLMRSPSVVTVAALMVLAPVLLLVLSLRTWCVLLSLIELSWVAHKLTRPLAIHPPAGCETVREAVLHLTPFRHEDYRAGRWPHDDIADKVRQIISAATGVPFAKIKDDSKLVDLCE